ncbi:EAL domain-containing protein [Parasphingopyxis sp.]|uniref:putative bifunctional diguanylate cyclase/phosphodiesterase n=1 Tax=Parasphingopyxis sp. TaxID=1920299 RepID=UPI002601C5D1|nr:EAL domain-containing protein [Parasphingopyxis sp.]
MAAIVERAGWTPIAARRLEKAERRFILSGSRIALVDARGAFEDGLAAIAALAEPVEANAAALVVLISKTDIAQVDAVFAAGATHYLASPFGEQELVQALRFADRFTERLGGRFHRSAELTGGGGDTLSWRFDPEGGEVALDPALSHLLGLSPENATLSAWDDFAALLGEKAAEEGTRTLRQLSETAEPTAFAHDMPGSGGQRMVHHLTLDEATGEVRGLVELPDEEADEPARAEHDYLTGIGDVRGAYRWIDRQLQAESGNLALLLISLHRFERINQAYGNAIGDAALKSMARRIERLVLDMPVAKKLVARLAGAEFAVGLAPGVTLDEAEFAARQLVSVIEQPFITDGQVIRLKARCGIVTDTADDVDAAAVMRRASVALAEARDSDSQPIRVFGVEEAVEAVRDSRLEIDLRLALDRDEIDILFQPQVSVTSGAVLGVEALARWRHPQFGELGAIALFAAAERSDYVTELSAHVQAKAVRMAAQWPDVLKDLRLSINVTAADMAEADFVDRFVDMVDTSGFERSRMTAEVTESGLIEDLGVAADRLARLRAEGFRVAIDDFGTGYSSLAYLKSLPLDYLKIDRRLSQDIAGSARDRIVVTGVIEMARSLGLSVIAEGVETQEQLELLAEQGCELYQGFLCSPPIDVEALAKTVSAQN